MLPNSVQYLLPGNNQKLLCGKVRRRSHSLGLEWALWGLREGRMLEKVGGVKSRGDILSLQQHTGTLWQLQFPKVGYLTEFRGRPAKEVEATHEGGGG